MNALPNKDIQNINEIRVIERICKVGHRNIVEFFSISKETWEKGPVCLIQMELCDGDMHSYIEQRYQTGDPLSFSEIADIMIQVLNGLSFLHEVHRDLKPRNGKPPSESG
jgi:serine/threonine protein kinase